MPLYEYHCLSCDAVFEQLRGVSDASKKQPCPTCGRKAPRIVSAFSISAGVSGEPADPVADSPRAAQDRRPMCMRYPRIPLSCHMDEYSVKRMAAHKTGRGNEFDDTVAQAAETRAARGLAQPQYAPATHGHDHGPGHSHAKNFRRHGRTSDHAHGPGHIHGSGKDKPGGRAAAAGHSR